MYNFMRVANMD